MTDPDADATYIEPLTREYLESNDENQMLSCQRSVANRSK